MNIEEVVLQASARMLYERETGRDWHTSPTDPGKEEKWRKKAEALREKNRRDPFRQTTSFME